MGILKINNEEFVVTKTDNEKELYTVWPYKGYCTCIAWRYSTPIKWCKHLAGVYKEYFPDNYVYRLNMKGYEKYEKLDNFESELFQLAEVKTSEEFVRRCGTWWISEKLDGIRVVWCHNSGRFYTRLGNPIYTVKLLRKLETDMPRDMDVEGELHFMNPKRTYIDVLNYRNSGMYMPGLENDKLCLTLYDMKCDLEKNMKFRDRYTQLKRWFKGLVDKKRLRLVKYVKGVDIKMIIEYKSKGYEGVVARNPDSVYFAGASLKVAIKYKFKREGEYSARVIAVKGSDCLVVENVRTKERKIVMTKDHDKDKFKCGDVVDVGADNVVERKVEVEKLKKE